MLVKFSLIARFTSLFITLNQYYFVVPLFALITAEILSGRANKLPTVFRTNCIPFLSQVEF